MAATTRNPFEQSRDIIRRAEEDLRGLLLKAVDEGDYDSVTKLNEYAKELRNLLDKTCGSSTLREATADIAPSTTGYPKFFKANDKLIMVGWSKKGGTEYKHEASKAILQSLVSALVNGSSNHDFVPIDKLIPLKDPETGAEFPQYQVRAFLRWLRHIEIVTKHGHQGYSIKQSGDLQSTINSAWRRLGGR
jgi:hypothetical protein